MSIFVIKIITLVVRTLAKPMIAWVTHYKKIALLQSESDINTFWKNRLINIGQNVDYYNVLLNRKMFRLKSEPIKKLPADKALERGAEFFSEVLVYSILISLPIIEFLRQNKTNKKKEYIKEQGLRRLKNDLENISEINKNVFDKVMEISTIVNQVDKEMNETKVIKENLRTK